MQTFPLQGMEVSTTGRLLRALADGFAGGLGQPLACGLDQAGEQRMGPARPRENSGWYWQARK